MLAERLCETRLCRHVDYGGFSCTGNIYWHLFPAGDGYNLPFCHLLLPWSLISSCLRLQEPCMDQVLMLLSHAQHLPARHPCGTHVVEHRVPSTLLAEGEKCITLLKTAM